MVWGDVPGLGGSVPAWSGGCTCLVWEGVYLPGPGGCTCLVWGCTCMVQGVYLHGPGGVPTWSGGCTCMVRGCTWSRGVPAWSRGCTCLVPGGYLPSPWGVPAWSRGCTWSGGYLPGLPPDRILDTRFLKILPCLKLRLRAVIKQ